AMAGGVPTIDAQPSQVFELLSEGRLGRRQLALRSRVFRERFQTEKSGLPLPDQFFRTTFPGAQEPTDDQSCQDNGGCLLAVRHSLPKLKGEVAAFHHATCRGCIEVRRLSGRSGTEFYARRRGEVG